MTKSSLWVPPVKVVVDENSEVTTFLGGDQKLGEALELASQGYKSLGDYKASIGINDAAEVVRDSNGDYWKVASDTALPYITDGTGLPEGGAFVKIGDNTLRQKLNTAVTSGEGALLVKGSTVNVSTISELKGIDTTRLVNGASFRVTTTGHAGEFTWIAGDQSSTLVTATATSDSVDSGTDTINDADHPFADGDGVIIQSAANGLSTNTVYWVVNSTTGTYQLSETFEGAVFDLTGTTNITVQKLLDPRQETYVSEDLTGSSGAWFRIDTHQKVQDDGGTEGAFNVKNVSEFSRIAPDIRMSYIAHGGHVNFPNIIGGFPGSNASYSTIGGGYDNQINSLAGTIAGGAHHRLNGDEANTTHNTIGGGSFNVVERGEYTTICGGTANEAKKLRKDGVTAVVSTRSAIGGGGSNIIRGANSTIAGGLNNSTDGDSVTVGGGQNNNADGNFNVVSGGGNNQANLGGSGFGQKNTIAGGRFNLIDSDTTPIANTISGGESNEAWGIENTVSGGKNNVVGASGAVVSNASILGGLDNTISSPATAGTIAGGRSNTLSGIYSFVSGRENSATAGYSSAQGWQGVASRSGERTLSSGQFSVQGDSQISDQPVKGISTAGNTVNLTTGEAEKPTAKTSHITLVTAKVIGSTATESQAFEITGLFDGGALVGTTTLTSLHGSITGSSVTLTSVGGGVLNLTCGATDAARWTARVQYVEMIGA